MFGIWNNLKKEFQFGICEDTPHKAIDKLFKKIGHDAFRNRFEVRKVPDFFNNNITREL